MAFAIKVNGTTHSVDVDGDTPLLWVLRDVLGMTGTKFGCGMALCGACTVQIDGAATRSCVTPIDSVGASAITTIEAIGATPPAPRSRRPGSTSKSFSAAIASLARSCPLPPFSPATRTRPIPTSTTRCPATSAAAEPMSAFAKPSSTPHNRSEGKPCHDPRSRRFPPRRPGPIRRGGRPLSAQVSARRRGRRRRPHAEPELTVQRRRSPRGRHGDIRAQRLHPHPQ